MKRFYMITFWIISAGSICLLSFLLTKNISVLSVLKDIGFPLGALLFTVGNLWHKKEDQEFEREKYSQERKDKYWDKRFEFYLELYNLVIKINYELKDEDIRLHPKNEEKVLPDIRMKLKMLSDKAEVLKEY